jgi:hypothetical protein
LPNRYRPTPICDRIRLAKREMHAYVVARNILR